MLVSILRNTHAAQYAEPGSARRPPDHRQSDPAGAHRQPVASVPPEFGPNRSVHECCAEWVAGGNLERACAVLLAEEHATRESRLLVQVDHAPWSARPTKGSGDGEQAWSNASVVRGYHQQGVARCAPIGDGLPVVASRQLTGRHQDGCTARPAAHKLVASITFLAFCWAMWT
jgi:hypothetical protein